MISGDKNPSESLQENVTSARQEIGRAIRESKTLKKRKKKPVKSVAKKKRKNSKAKPAYDIFDEDDAEN